ncbi:MAG: polyhydroxyalkanoate synthesis repressor PhaR [Alphaproteobacteria bacterium]|nr:polyhydroxyalkanoate synthesis repressor PhaR [Alphaproteobacteria bacterium]
MAKAKNDGPTVIKKYANRRLYDTGRSSYVTLDDLCEMIQEGHDFVVLDAKSGEDLTRSVLTQIIVDQESRGETLLPTNFLRTLIGFYGDKMQGFVPGYLEQTLDVFVKNQEHLREQINKSIEGMRSMEGMFPGAPNLEELRKQNMEMFERAMKMMTPFGMPYGNSGKGKDE